MEKLSKEYMVQQVINHKDRLKEATDELSRIFSEARIKRQTRTNLGLDEETSLQIRKIVHEIMEEISIIGGFCDGSTQDYIHKISLIVAGKTAFDITILDFCILELFAARVNSIIVDFTKTPFRLSDLKPILSVLAEAAKKR
jgi:hypothetical protein